MDKKRWYFCALTIGTALALIWCWYEFVYWRLQQQTLASTATITHLEQKKALIPDLQYQVDTLRQYNERVRNELQLTVLNQEHIDPYIFLEHVLLHIDEAGLQLALLMPQEFKHKTFYEKCTFGFKALGTYEQIMLLLNHFCEKHPNSVFKKVNITHAQNKLLVEAFIAIYVVDKDGL